MFTSINVLVLSSSKSGDFAQVVIMILLWILGITIIVAKKFDVDPNTLF
ncbi:MULTISPECIES: hypothetical protein [Flavobacterium]|nr:hypothetical protein [Flavobacterium sp. N1846]